MLTFTYEARDAATGKKVKSTVQADSERAAAKLVREQGLSPLSIKQEDSGTKGIFNKVKTKDRILFARQLSTLINAGIPLVQGLRMTQKQSASKPMQAVLSDVIADIEAGQSFAAALTRHPEVFGTIFTSLVAAGEVSGTLDKALERLAMQQEKDAEIQSKIRGAMVYPIIVILVMVAVVGFMIVSVLPQVKIMYDGMKGAKLPMLTSLLLGLSNLVIKYWWAFVVLIGIGGFFSGKWARSVTGKRFFDKVKMRTPPLGPLFMKVYMARFARTGSTLIASGVPLLQMLEITGKSINNVYIEESIARAIMQVKGGKSLADALEGDPNFLELVPNMLRIGEQSGAVESMLSKTADYYEKEVDDQVKAISTIIEPILMVLLGIVALIIVAAVLLPIYSLSGQNLAG